MYTGLLEIDSQSMTERLTRYAVCPNCYPTQPLPACLNHFTVEYCAKKLVQGLPVVCPKVCGRRFTCLYILGLLHRLCSFPNQFLLIAYSGAREIFKTGYFSFSKQHS